MPTAPGASSRPERSPTWWSASTATSSSPCGRRRRWSARSTTARRRSPTARPGRASAGCSDRRPTSSRSSTAGRCSPRRPWSASPTPPCASASSTSWRASSSACRSARSRPCSTASPTCPVVIDGGRHPHPQGGVGPRPRRARRRRLGNLNDITDGSTLAAMAFVFTCDGAARRHRPQPPLPRRLRLRRGVRHPDVLPAGPRLGARPRTTRPSSASPSPTASSAPWRTDHGLLPLPRGRAATATRCAASSPRRSPPRWSTACTPPAPSTPRSCAGRSAREGFLDRAVPGLGKGDPIELYVLFSELEKAGAPYDGLAIAVMIAGVVTAVGTDEQKARILPDDHLGRGAGVHGLQRARQRLRPGRHHHPRRARRRRVGDQRGEDVDHHGPRGQVADPAHPHRPRPGATPWADDVHPPDGHPWHHRRPGAHHGHRAHQRHLLRRRPGRRRGRARRRQRRAGAR